MSVENKAGADAGDLEHSYTVKAIDWTKVFNLSHAATLPATSVFAKSHAAVNPFVNGALQNLAKQVSLSNSAAVSGFKELFTKQLSRAIMGTPHHGTYSITSQLAKNWARLGFSESNPFQMNIGKALGIGVNMERIVMPRGVDWAEMISGMRLGEILQTAEPADLEVFRYQSDVAELEATPTGRIILLHETSQAKQIIRDVYRNNHSIFNLHPRAFEEMIAELLREQGFETELTKQTRDGGYDILAISKAGPFPVTFIAECKRYAKNRPVDVNIMRSFGFVLNKKKASKGIMFTTSYFTKDTRIEAAAELGNRLEFMEYEDILKWIKASPR